jgi:hypothetical protein
MPLAAIQKLGSVGNWGSSTVDITLSRDIQVGEFLVLALSERDWGIVGVADNSVQSGTANSYVQDIFNNLAGDDFTYIYSCKVTRKILATNTITATFNGPISGKSGVLYALPEATGTSPKDVWVYDSGTGGTVFDTGLSTTTSQGDEYLIGVACAHGDPGTITFDGTWVSQFAGTPGSGYAYAHAAQITTTPVLIDFSGGWGADVGNEWSAVGISYKGVAGSGTVTPVYNADGSLLVSGNQSLGATLTAVHGNWTPTPSGYTYRWQRADDASGTNLVDIGATGANYVVQAADVAKYLRCGVTALP